MKIYGDKISGNCYKIQLVCHLLKLDYEWVDVDVVSGGARTPDFVAKNPNAKVPLLALDDGRFLSESNAIINFLAVDSALLPKDVFTLAKVQQWQFFEQYSHEPFIAVARFINKFQGMPESRRDEYLSKHEGGYKALQVMEDQLQQTRYLVGEAFTVADVALYAYTHVAHEGGFSLANYPQIQRWIKDIESLDNFVAMGR
ncbi:Disulfide-bond oxidoreductase YfcG [Thalassocella blandensis]|nr:Disulfide-bond oxidoreductase YfcG [Thalassocella blandensis]